MKTYHVKFETTIRLDADSKDQAQRVAAARMDRVAGLVPDECDLISCKEAPTDEGMNLVIGSASHNETTKARFEREATSLLHAVALHLGLKSGTYDLRYTAAGIACSGDATLHADNVYVSFNLDGGMEAVLVRTCTSRKDYTGGPNRWYSFRQLAQEGAEGLAEFIRHIMDGC